MKIIFTTATGVLGSATVYEIFGFYLRNPNTHAAIPLAIGIATLIAPFTFHISFESL